MFVTRSLPVFQICELQIWKWNEWKNILISQPVERPGIEVSLKQLHERKTPITYKYPWPLGDCMYRLQRRLLLVSYCLSVVCVLFSVFNFLLSVLSHLMIAPLRNSNRFGIVIKIIIIKDYLLFLIPFNSEIFVINLIRGNIIAHSWVSFDSNQQFIYSGVCFRGFELCIEKWSNQKYEVFY